MITATLNHWTVMKTTVTPNTLDMAKISPKRGSKFSPNLYAWLNSKNNKCRAWFTRVYRSTEGTLFIGFLEDSELIGSKLMGVLCNGAKEWTYAFQNVDAIEVPDFWQRYTEVGRCAIDPDHKMYFLNDDSRWLTDGDTRSCQWCGNASQVMTRWTESVERQEWRAAA